MSSGGQFFMSPDTRTSCPPPPYDGQDDGDTEVDPDCETAGAAF
jgi:hypothetical protein